MRPRLLHHLFADMVLALQSLKYVRLLRKMRIGILLTTDDSLQGRFSKNIIHKKSSCAEYIIGLHGAFSDGGMVTSRSGAAFYNFKMNLKKPTSNFDVPMAGLVFSKLLADWVRLSDEESGIIVSPKKARLDSKISEPYVHGEALLSVRFNESAQFQDIDSKLRKAIPYGKYKSKIEFQLEGGLRRPAMINNSQVQDMFERIKQIAKNLDIPMKGEHRWSSADICLADANKARIDGFGPNGTKDTNGDEYIFKHALTEKALILAMLLHDLNGRRQLPEV